MVKSNFHTTVGQFDPLLTHSKPLLMMILSARSHSAVLNDKSRQFKSQIYYSVPIRFTKSSNSIYLPRIAFGFLRSLDFLHQSSKGSLFCISNSPPQIKLCTNRLLILLPNQASNVNNIMSLAISTPHPSISPSSGYNSQSSILSILVVPLRSNILKTNSQSWIPA